MTDQEREKVADRLPGISGAELAEVYRIRDEAVELMRMSLEGVLSAAVSRLGGEVEGAPTSRINFLQRIEELREVERGKDDAVREAIQKCADECMVVWHDHRHGEGVGDVASACRDRILSLLKEKE